MGVLGLVMIDFKRSLYPTLIFITFCALISSVTRPDYNVMLAPILMMVLRQGERENFALINLILFFTSFVDCIYLGVQSQVLGWLYAPTAHTIGFAFSVVNIIAKVFLILFNIIVLRNWNDESPSFFLENPAENKTLP